MMEQGSVRNLEQIQEEDEGARVPRGVTAVLVALGGAAVLFAGLSLAGKSSVDAPQKVDPLGDLVASKSHGAKGPQKVPDLSAKDVTFPGLLSDGDRPTTALAAAKAAPPSAGVPDAPAAVPPPAADRLPVVPLPASHVLSATPVVTKPKDTLTKAASEAAQISEPTATAPSGHEGGYQLQISSFRTQPEADQFCEQLRARGHKAYVQEANVPGRGTWYRVRIGPFPTQTAAAQYRIGFEGKEHVVPFVVPPKDAKDGKEPSAKGSKKSHGT